MSAPTDSATPKKPAKQALAELLAPATPAELHAMRLPRWPIYLCLALVCLGQSSRYFTVYLINDDIYDRDLPQHVWWMERFVDPQIYPNDPIANFYAQPVFAPAGYQLLYWIFTHVTSPQRISEVIPFVLMGLVTVLAWAIGFRVGGGSHLAGLAAAIYVIADNLFLRRMYGGFPRTFALPLLMLGLWAMLDRRMILLGATMLLGSLLYPPSNITLGACVALSEGVRLFRSRRLPKNWIWAAALGCVAVGIMLWIKSHAMPAEFGPQTTGAQAREMVEFTYGGRTPFFSDKWEDFWFIGIRTGYGISPDKLLSIGLAILVTCLLFRRLLPLELWALLISATALFFIAHATLFTLYLPSRITLYVIPIFKMIWIAALTARVSALLWRALPALRLIYPMLARPAPLLAIGLTCACFAAGRAFYLYSDRSPPNWPKDQLATYAFLKTLPADALIAAHPFSADHIPIGSKRSVLASDVVLLPYYQGYYKLMQERINAELAATYATDWSAVDALAERFGVDVFVLDLQNYNDRKHMKYYPPFKGTEWRGVADRLGEFVLLNAPAERIMFRSGRYAVVRVGR